MINTVFVVLTWLIGIVATVGPVAAIIGIIAFPAIVVPLISKITKALLGCIPCMIALAVVLACVGSYWVGHIDAASDCRDEQLQAELRNKQIDLDNAKKAKADEAARADTIEVTADEQRKKDAEYISRLEARPSCLLDESDIGGVRNDKPGTSSKKPAAGTK